MDVTTKRIDAPGYLEFIWKTRDLKQQGPGKAPVLAYITDIYGEPARPWYTAVYGIHWISGPTVAAVKEELFSMIDNGQ